MLYQSVRVQPFKPLDIMPIPHLVELSFRLRLSRIPMRKKMLAACFCVAGGPRAVGDSVRMRAVGGTSISWNCSSAGLRPFESTG